ncbi:hypothetical protein BP5796_08374 [Coleophoma crateriformis]|uniref:Uncharacterized protein n=1 Tax=Coleophoma crateriformis TaxID=565419 RepID=A0A3D8R7I1_9HELO|nr:hypothetical protein BP5796_08374 [Coleophoma crateriformis]
MQSNSTACWSSDGFGPVANVQTCGKDTFDFTLVFEQSIMSIGPSAVLLLVAPLRWIQLQSQRRITKSGEMTGWIKQGFIITFSLVQLAQLILWARFRGRDPLNTGVSVASITLGLCGCIALAFLSYAEHTRNLRPSTTICVYLVASLAFDAVQCRTLWLLPADPNHHIRSLAAVLSSSIAVKTIMLFLEARGKRRSLLPAFSANPPEVLSGILTRGVFWWLNELLLRGYRGSISLQSLWPTDDRMASSRLAADFASTWTTAKHEKGKYSMLIVLVTGLKWPFLVGVVPRICLIGLKFSQPLLIHRIVAYVGQPGAQNDQSIGYGLLGATALIYLGIGIMNGIHSHKLYRFITMARGCLVSMVFRKTLSMSTATAQEKGSKTLTLISTDVGRITRGLEGLHEMWASPIEVGLAIFLLERELGVACIAPGIIALLSTFAIMKLTAYIGPAQVTWNKGVQERVSVTSAMLGNMKEVKLLGLTDFYSQRIKSLRSKELNLAKRTRSLGSMKITLMSISRYLTPAVTFGAFIAISKYWTGQPLSVTTSFTSLSLLVLLATPLSSMFNAMPQLSMTVACLERIRDFLLENEVQEALGSDGSSTKDEGGWASTGSHAGIELATLTKQVSSRDLYPNTIISLKGASMGVKESGQPIVHGLSFTVPRSSLTVVIGKVGSGKSTLLKGLVGELSCVAGSLKREYSSAAYCEQQPWLVNGTIQSNILGAADLEARWYETVVTACALNRDFETLPSGDLSLIGSKGISLSGGQKRRVALARALYSRLPLLICDDVLSGLDWNTQEEIWKNVFSRRGGLLSQYEITTVLATHAVHHLREADKIIVLSEDGTITEQGTFETLNKNQSYVQKLLLGEKGDVNSGQDKEAGSPIKDKPTIKSKASAEDGNDLLRRTGDAQVYKYYLKSIGWRHGLILLFLTVGGEFCLAFPQLWVKWWAEADTAHPGSQTRMYYSVYLVLGVVGLAFVAASVSYNWVITGPSSGLYLHHRLLDIITKAPLSFFVETDTGITVNRFSQDLSLIDNNLPGDSFLTVLGIFQCIGGALLIVSGIKYMAAVIPLSLVFLYTLQLFYLRTSRQMRHMDLEAKSPLYTHLLEIVQGISTIRSFGWATSFFEGSLQLLDISQKPFYLMFCIQRWLNFSLDMFVAALAVIFVGIAVALKGQASAGSVGLALLNILSLNASLAYTITTWTGLETSLGAIARLKNLENDTPREDRRDVVADAKPGWPLTGDLAFENVNVSYKPDSNLVLKNISLSIQAGQRVAICGRTGSGKSSLLLALFRLLDLQSGDIKIDGLSISTVSRTHLRSRMNIVPQEPIFLPGSVRLNLDPFSTASDMAILSALTSVSLGMLVETHGGLDASMPSLPLSQGQRQLFCLARAVVRSSTSPILILDEAGSSVDDATEEMMQKVIRREFRTQTILAVVHKLDTVRDFDRIAVLEQGVLAEFDSPDRLLEKEGGAFRSLWESRHRR